MQRFTYPLIAFVAFGLLSLVIHSCADHDLADFDNCEEVYSYSLDVAPIVTAKCAISGCHDGSMGDALDWSDPETFQAKARSGLVRHKVKAREMPPPGSPAGALSDDQIAIIACWSNQGAPNN
jgi:hypothetical protein